MLKNKLLKTAMGVFAVSSVTPSLSSRPVVSIDTNLLSKLTTTVGVGYGFEGLGSIELTGSFAGGMKQTKDDMYKSLGSIVKASAKGDTSKDAKNLDLGKGFLNNAFAGAVGYAQTDDKAYIQGNFSGFVAILTNPKYTVDATKSFIRFKPLHFGLVGHFNVWRGLHLDTGMHLNLSKVELKVSLKEAKKAATEAQGGAATKASSKTKTIEQTYVFKPRKIAPYFGISYAQPVYRFSNNGSVMLNASFGLLWQGKFSIKEFKYKKVDLLEAGKVSLKLRKFEEASKTEESEIKQEVAKSSLSGGAGEGLSFKSKLLTFMPIFNVGLKIQF